MKRALILAEGAADAGEVPVGCVLVDSEGVVVAEGANCREGAKDPLGHAELVAIRKAALHLERWRLSDLTMYVTLEPCSMCAGAIVQSRIARVVFAAFDPKAGAVCSLFRLLDDPRLNHRVSWEGGVLQQEARAQLQAFFRARRSSKP